MIWNFEGGTDDSNLEGVVYVECCSEFMKLIAQLQAKTQFRECFGRLFIHIKGHLFYEQHRHMLTFDDDERDGDTDFDKAELFT